VSATQPSNSSKPRRVMPTPPRGRRRRRSSGRPSGSGGWSRGRRCPSGRTSPRAAGARSSSARPRGASRAAAASLEPVELLRLRAEPDRLGLERRLRAGRARRGRASLPSGSPSSGSDHLLGDGHLRRRRRRAEAALLELAATIAVSDSFFACV
jgi:hypothetical protein